MRQQAFEDKGRFFKGNLHTHTDKSDGKRNIDEIVGIYKSKGYDFIAVTDHNIVFKSDKYNRNGFYIVPAVEIHSQCETDVGTHHMVALTTYSNKNAVHGERIENIGWTKAAATAKELTGVMREKGYKLIYCHSLWSRMHPEDFMDSELMAMEIYNGLCDYKWEQGYQEIHWDDIIRKGKKLWGVASDDCHGKDEHYGRAFVMVKSRELSDEGIISALEKGSFYSSRGPEIYDFYINGGKAFIKCSPVNKITFICYENLGESFVSESSMTGKSFGFNEKIKYIRMEITDNKGMKAWTNPIFL